MDTMTTLFGGEIAPRALNNQSKPYLVSSSDPRDVAYRHIPRMPIIDDKRSFFALVLT